MDENRLRWSNANKVVWQTVSQPSDFGILGALNEPFVQGDIDATPNTIAALDYINDPSKQSAVKILKQPSIEAY